MKKSIFNLIKIAFLVIFSCALNGYSQQNILISQGGTVQVNDGDMFYDAGGSSGNDGNTNYTITLTPAISGERICLDFTSFITYYDASYQRGDSLCIFDGSTTSSNKIATLMGDYSKNFSTATTPTTVGIKETTMSAAVYSPGIFCSTNVDGSLTITFYNTSTSQFAGWVAKITTYKSPTTEDKMIFSAKSENISSGEAVTLTASGNLSTAKVSNNFNTSTVGTDWSATSAIFSNNLCSKPGLDGSIYMWMANGVAPRNLTSPAVDVSNGGFVSFEYRQASLNGDPSPCESPDVKFGAGPEAIYVQYTVDAGATWKPLKAIFPYDMKATSSSYYPGCGYETTLWNKVIVPIPLDARAANTKFRWVQPYATSATTDNWGLDNVEISSNKTKTITITNVSTGEIVGSSTSSPYSLDVSPTTTTTYMAIITDGFSTATNEITINVTQGGCTPPTVDAGKDTTICLGNNVQLNVNTVGTYAWSPATGLDAANISSPIATPTVTTTYSIVVTAQGGCSNSDTIIITVNDCDNLSQKDTVANDTTGIKIDNVITVSIDTCVFNYNAPLDSFKIIGYSITQTDLILNWVFYQHPNVITVNSKTPLVSIKDGNNLVYLTIQCTKNTSLRSIYKTVFVTNFTYLGTTEIKKFAESKIHIFPNPTSGMLTIVLPSNLKTGATLELYTIDSKKLLSLKANQQSNVLDMSAYPAGVYMLKVISEEGMMIERIVKY